MQPDGVSGDSQPKQQNNQQNNMASPSVPSVSEMNPVVSPSVPPVVETNPVTPSNVPPVPETNPVTPSNVPPVPEANPVMSSTALPVAEVSYQQAEPLESAILQSSQPAVKKDDKKRKWIISGVIIGIVLIGVAVVIGLLVPHALVVGDWACAKYSWTTNDYDSEPTVMLKLKTNGTFVYGQYGDLDNNHYAGTYTATPLDKKDEKFGYKFYSLTFGPTTEFVQNGVKQDATGRQLDNMEIGVGVSGLQRMASLVLESSYVMYACKTE